MHKKKTFLLALAVVLIGLGALFLHTRLYNNFIVDDALISLRYVERFLQGKGLTWNDGECVEGYSNLLWILATSALGFLRIDLIDALRILGFAGMGAVMAAIAFAYPPVGLLGFLATLFPVLALAASGSIAAWTIGGLEQPLVAALLAWGLVLSYPLLEKETLRFRDALLPGLLFGCLCITRPDGALFTAAVALGLLLLRGFNQKTFKIVFSLAILPALFYLGQLGFRLAYYGEWVPNTALVKLALTWRHIFLGLVYLGTGMMRQAPLILFCLGFAYLVVTRADSKRRLLFLSVPIGVWSLYITFAGMDMFPAHRMLIPNLVILVLMAAEVLRELPQQTEDRRRFYSGLSLLMIVAMAWNQASGEGYGGSKNYFEWDGKVVGTMLNKAFYSQQPLMAVDPAGCMPYWSKLPSLDMLGLNDYYLPRHKPARFGTVDFQIGHELGDGKYVLRRKPDLVVFALPIGGYPCFISGLEMLKEPEFLQNYNYTAFLARENPPLVSKIWVRKNSPKIGVRLENGAILIPPYLLENAVARLDDREKLVGTVFAEAPAKFSHLRLPKGRWSLEIQSNNPLSIQALQGEKNLLASNGPFTISEETPVTLVVSSNDLSTDISEIRLQRI